MQREAYKKSFTFHERFVLEVDPSSRCIQGSAELTIQPLQKLSSIRINCRQCQILSTSVNKIQVEHTYTDPVAELTLGSNTTIAHHQVYKSKYLNALRESDDGELSITIPEDCMTQMSESEAQMISNQVFPQEDMDSHDDPAASEKATPTAPEPRGPSYAPIFVRVDFRLDNPRSGIVFVESDDDVAPYRSPHLYTVNQPLPGATRAWLPCIDRLAERCTWDMEFIVPRKMGVSNVDFDAEATADGENATVVVCSGDVVEQVVHPTDVSKKIVHCSLSVPTAAPFIGFAIGPFEMIKLSPSQLQEEVLTAAELDENQQQSLMAEINMMSNIYAFALPGLEEELSISCSFLMHAMHFYAQEYGSYPFSDYKLVFVEDAWSNTTSTASLAICSSHLLHSGDTIDQVYHTRRMLSLALARQWFGIHIIQKSWSDTWLVIGLANLMGSLFIKRNLGNNEYRLRMKRDMELCCSLDVNRPPLCNPALPSPLDPDDLDFLELKAPLVLYMLDKRMCKVGVTLGLSRVIPKILVSAMSGELPQNAISTHYFMRLCRKVSGFDTKEFADQWVYKSGCPKFSFSFHFNRKKMVVEIFMRQENTNTAIMSGGKSAASAADSGVMNYQDFMAPLFTGNLTVRIHEADGTPYEHILDIQSAKNKFEVQFNTKYKRIRRNTKRFLAKQAAAAAAVAEEEQENEDGDGATTNVLGIIPSLGLGMPIFEDPQQRQEWGVVEWGQDEEDTSGAASAMFDWIRLDADFEWISVIEFQQPDYMWAAQLTKDKDVVAQHDAINALKRMPSLPTSTSLLRGLMDPKCFYKIRMEAAYALATCATPEFNWVGLLQLNKMFLKRYCFPFQMDLDHDDLPFHPAIPKPNNFSSFPDYFIQKAVVIAFSQVRDQHGLTPIRVRQFLLDLLKYNDNVGNEFSDSYYVSTLISALGDSLIPASDVRNALTYDGPEGARLLAAAKSEIERFRTVDYVIPSYHNVVTVTCLKTITKLMLNNLMEVDLIKFMPYTRYGNYVEVRLAAFDSLFVLAGLTNPTMTKFFISVVKDDPCESVSHYVARSMLAWLGLAMKERADILHSRHVEEFAEEEGRVMIDDDRHHLQKTPQQEFQASVENLRKRFESDMDLQQTLWDLINAPEHAELDHCIRKYLLQFCEFTYKPLDVGLKVTIRVPTLSAPETQEDMSEPSTPTQPVIRFNKPKATVSRKDGEKPTKSRKRTVSIKTEVPTQIPTPTSASMPASHTTPPTLPPVKAALKTTTTKAAGMPAKEAQECERVLQALTKHPSAILFLQPVDEVQDGAPDYYTIIKKPVDLGKIKDKLHGRKYTSFDQFESDVRLMFSNCFQYNSPGTYVYNSCQELESTFEEERARHRRPAHEETQNMTIVESPAVSPKAPSVTLPPSQPPAVSSAPPSSHVALQPPPQLKEKKVERAKTDKERCTVILAKTMENRHAFEFLRPVDPIKQGIPHYSTIIKTPMDLGTVKSKLKADQYRTPQQFDDDVRLMFRNCFAFNPPNTYVYNEAKQLEDVYNAEWSAYYDASMKSPADRSTSVPARVSSTPTISTPSVPKTPPPPKPVAVVNGSAEPSPSAAAPVRPDMNSHNKHRVNTILKKLCQHPSSQPFRDPVDITAPELAVYAQIIKRPMDLSTVRKKLESNQFPTIWAFEKDVRQIFWNCYLFNEAASWIAQQGKALEDFFNQTWFAEFAEAQALRGDDRRLAQKTITKMMAHHAAPLFNEPVDVDAIPDYAIIIKTPMDLRTISEKIESGKYTHLRQVDADIRLVFANCYKYKNPDACREGKILEKYYENACRELRQRAKDQPSSTASTTAKRTSASPAPMSASSSKVAVAKPSPTPAKSSKSTAVKPAEAPAPKAPKETKPAEKYDPSKLHSSFEPKLNSLLNKLMKHKAAIGFLEPVDPILLNIPHYPLIIKNPMDLGTAQKKLKAGEYSSLRDFESDVQLVFTNCYTFNGFDHIISQNAKILEGIFNKEMQALRRKEEQLKAGASSGSSAASTSKPSKTPNPATKKTSSSPSPSKTELKKYKEVLRKLHDHPSYYPFGVPVDPVKLQIPTYTDIIKHPMDLGTIRKRLDRSEYADVDQLLRDVRQVFVNCYTFNLADDIVYKMGKDVEAEFNKLSRSYDLKTIHVDAPPPQVMAAKPEVAVKREVEVEDQDFGTDAKRLRTDN